MSTVWQSDTQSIGQMAPPERVEKDDDPLELDPPVLNLWSQMSKLTGTISDETLQLAMAKVMSDLVFLLDYLRIVGSDQQQPKAFNEALAILDNVRGEASALAAFVENHAMLLDGVDSNLKDTLDCTAYAIKLECRRIFESELAELQPDQADEDAWGLLIDARGVLTNCFQQSMINLARVFDESVSGGRLFPDWQVRRERSLQLCRDLSDLIDFINAGERGRDGLIERLDSFREGSMQYLMYRDWKQYEIFRDQIVASIRNGELPVKVMHRLSCYLEALLRHVQSRSVLVDSVSERFCIAEQVDAI
jgi:hypothetical protein